MDEEIILMAKNIKKFYSFGHRHIEVLCGVNLEVRKGEKIAIVGPSGCGKTTLLNILGGLDKPDEGEVFIKGENIYKLSESKRARIRAQLVGFVFQSYQLFPELTVFENIILPTMSGNTGISGNEAYNRANSLLKSINLYHRSDHLPAELSGGEQQRVAVVRAMINKPEIIFADEPTGNLDYDNAKCVISSLMALASETNCAILIVSYNESLVRMCDRILRLEKGVLKAF